MRKYFFILALVLAQTPPAMAGEKIVLDDLRSQNYESIISTKDQTPRFTFHAPKGLNPSHFMGGVVGIVMHTRAAERGSEILSQYEVTEPAFDISKELARLIGERLQLSYMFQDSGLNSSIAATHFTLRSAKYLSDEYGPDRLVINVGTNMWSLSGTGNSKFRIIYAASAQLVDTRNRRVLAKSGCSFPLKKAHSARDAETMFDNDAASLKAEFQEATDFCINRIMSDFFRS